MTRTRNKLILSDKLYVPGHLIKDRDLRSNWYYEWDEVITEEARDPFGDLVYDNRGNPELITRVEERRLKTYKEVYHPNGNLGFVVPRGDFTKIATLVKQHPTIDKRPIAPLGFQLKLKRFVRRDPRWRRDQRRCVAQYMKKGYGILRGDPGSGKTVMGAAILCRLGLRTLILSKRTDGNEHWEKELRTLTNIDAWERRLNMQLLGVYNTKEGVVYPITIATVQSFISKRGRRDRKRYKNYFGLVVGDEVHELVTPKYSTVPAAFNSLTRCGLTATDERTDRLHYLEYDLFGPVTAVGNSNQMEPTVTFIETGEEAPGWVYKTDWHPGAKWNKCLTQFEKSARRYDIIMQWLYKDIEDGRVIACISPTRRSFVKELERRLRQDGYRVAYVDGTTKNRKQIYDDVNRGRYDVLCAGKVLDALVNIPAMDCLHLVSPLSKHSAIKQIYGRPRREMKGKRAPIIRDYVDKGGQFTGAYKSRLKLVQQLGWKTEFTDASLADVRGVSYWSPNPR